MDAQALIKAWPEFTKMVEGSPLTPSMWLDGFRAASGEFLSATNLSKFQSFVSTEMAKMLKMRKRKSTGPTATLSAPSTDDNKRHHRMTTSAVTATTTSSTTASPKIPSARKKGSKIYSPIVPTQNSPPLSEEKGKTVSYNPKLERKEGRCIPRDSSKFTFLCLNKVEQNLQSLGEGGGGNEGDPRKFPYEHTWQITTPAMRIRVIDDRLYEMASVYERMLSDVLPGDGGGFQSTGVMHSGEVAVVGRVVGDVEGPLNAASCMLEGDKRLSNCARVELRLAEQMPHVLFPGQIVVAVGSNDRHKRFIATKIVCGLPTIPPSIPNTTLNRSLSKFGGEPVHIAILNGPFFSPNEIQFDAFEAMLKKTLRSQPHVLILMGPFLDSRNRLLTSGALSIQSSEENVGDNHDDPRTRGTVLFEDMYAQFWNVIADSIKTENQSSEESWTIPPVRIIIVPSTFEVGHPYPLPQPPMNLQDLTGGGGDIIPLRQVTFASNPCRCLINGEVQIAVTSVDLVGPVLSRKVGQGVDSVLRAILAQRSFAPSDPPAEQIPVEFGLYDNLYFDDAGPTKPPPALIIFASASISKFVREVDGHIFVNLGVPDANKKPCAVSDIFLHPCTASSSSDGDMTSHVPLKLPERVRVDMTPFSL